jgi:phage-related protein
VNRKEPVRDWLMSLNQEDRKTIGDDIKTVEMGWPLGMPLVEKFEQNLWEVRSKISAGCIARVFFTIIKQDMVLLHGFVKKDMKTPLKDKNLAKSRRDKVRGK